HLSIAGFHSPCTPPTCHGFDYAAYISSAGFGLTTEHCASLSRSRTIKPKHCRFVTLQRWLTLVTPPKSSKSYPYGCVMPLMNSFPVHPYYFSRCGLSHPYQAESLNVNERNFVC